MNNRVEQLLEKEASMREVLLAMPREMRAREQGMVSVFTFGPRRSQITVKRYSRKYWYVGASLLRLDDAEKAVSK